MPPDWRRANALLDQLLHLLPQLSYLAVGDAHRWMGERPSIDLSPFAPDRFGAAREPESRHYR
jgi:glycine/D-amino acid oxidase-like deaminating enzyme